MTEKEQIPPKGDNRYRTHRSVKCYVAKLECGSKWCTWYFSESIERVVYLFPGRIEKVVYNNRFYNLKMPDEMKEIVIHHLAEKGAVNIAGNKLGHYEKDQSFEPYPFIDITDTETYNAYKILRLGWLNSDDFKNA